MDCQDALDRLDDLATRDLYGTEAARVMLHLRRCYLCHEEYDEVEEMLRDCRENLRHPEPEDRWDALLARIEAERPATTPAPAREWRAALALTWRRRLIRGLAAAGAAAALALCLGPRPDPNSSELSPILPAVWNGTANDVVIPASAAARSLYEYRSNIEQYLDASSPTLSTPAPQALTAVTEPTGATALTSRAPAAAP